MGSFHLYGELSRLGINVSWAIIVRFACGERGGLPYISRYRNRETPVRCGKVKNLTADGDAEADGLKESDLTAGKRKGLCCTLKGIKAQKLKHVFNKVSCSTRLRLH